MGRILQMMICAMLSAPCITEQWRLIVQLFWQGRIETEVADAMGTHQSTVNRRKRAILNGLRMKLRDQNEFQRSSA